MKIQKNISIFLITVLVVGIGWYFRVHERLFAEFIDSEQHFLPCEKLPNLETVKEIMSTYRQEIAEIEKAYGHCVWFSLGDGGTNCKDTADILIGYCNHQQRVEIRNIIGKTFHGIPWRGINQ